MRSTCPTEGEQLSKWLGPAKNIGNAMTFWILKENGQAVVRSTVRPLTTDEWTDEIKKRERGQFDEKEGKILGNFNESLIHEPENDQMEEPLTDPDPDRDD